MLYIDITRLCLYIHSNLSQVTGVDKVNLAYIRYLGETSCAVIRYPKYWLFLPYNVSQVFFKSLLIGKLKRLSTIAWIKKFNALRYSKPMPDEQNFLLHTSHGGLEKPEFLTFMAKYQLKGIYFLHDLIPIDYPEYCRDGEKQKHQVRLQTMSQGELVICNSRYTLARWQDYCDKHSLTFPKSIFAHLAPDDIWQHKTAEISEVVKLIVPTTPYFVVLGTIEGRKNHLLLLNIWRQLWRERNQDCPKLVIIGKRGWECEQVLDILDRSDELNSVVVEMNNCSDKDLNYFMHHCQALLFPSFEEGYGLPLIEAFRSGVRVIASQIPAFEEINIDNVATLISPIDSEQWKQTILEQCYINNEQKLSYQQKIANIQPKLPTWQQHFDIVKPHMKFL